MTIGSDYIRLGVIAALAASLWPLVIAVEKIAKWIKAAVTWRRKRRMEEEQETILDVLLDAQGTGLAPKEVEDRSGYKPDKADRILRRLRRDGLAYFMNGRWYARNPVVKVDRFGH